MTTGVTLQTYLLQVRRLLRDPNAQFWQDSELIDYINEGRNYTVGSTGCLRSVQSVNLVAGQEAYDFSIFTQHTPVIDVLSINLVWGQTKYVLQYKDFTYLTATLRYQVNYQQQPLAFSVVGQTGFYVSPIPDIVYPIECDTVYMPSALVNYSDVCPIVYPFNLCVKYYAAYLAQVNGQSYEKSDKMIQLFRDQVNNSLAQSYTRRIPDVYS